LHNLSCSEDYLDEAYLHSNRSPYGWRGLAGDATGGAVAGSMVGDRVGAQSQPVQRCRTIESSREVVNGYNVVYRYNGRDVNVALPYNPGNTIKVGVGIILDDHAADAARDSGHDRDVSRRPQPVTAVDTTVPANNANYTYRY